MDKSLKDPFNQQSGQQRIIIFKFLKQKNQQISVFAFKNLKSSRKRNSNDSIGS